MFESTVYPGVTEDVRHEYGLELRDFDSVSDVDGIILSTNHQAYESYALTDLLTKIPHDPKVFVDIKGV